MPYFPVNIRLTNRQKQAFVRAIHNNTRLKLTFSADQIGLSQTSGTKGGGDIILVTEKQIQKLNNAYLTRNNATINFNKTQLRMMADQIGNGILDSIKGAFTSVKNWFTGTKKPPKPIEMKTFNKKLPKMVGPGRPGPTKPSAKAGPEAFFQNTKPHPQKNEAEAFFAEQARLRENPNPHRKAGFFTPYEQMRLDRISKMPDPVPLVTRDHPTVSSFHTSNATRSVASSSNPGHPAARVVHQRVKYQNPPPMTAKERAIAEYKMQRDARDAARNNNALSSNLDKVFSVFDPSVISKYVAKKF